MGSSPLKFNDYICLVYRGLMGVIKVNISAVYAKAKDRNMVHVYKKGVRSKPGFTRLLDSFHSGNTSLIRQCTKKITLYSTQHVQVPEKTYNTCRLVLLHSIPKVYDLTKEDFCFYFPKLPHQLLKYHVIASGARADRTSQGMRKSFGTPFMRCLKPSDKNQTPFPFVTVHLSSKYEKHVSKLKHTLLKLKCKLPFKGYVKIQDLETHV